MLACSSMVNVPKWATGVRKPGSLKLNLANEMEVNRKPKAANICKVQMFSYQREENLQWIEFCSSPEGTS